MKNRSIKKAAARRYAAAILAVVAAFALTYVLCPRLAVHPAPLLIAAALPVVWLDYARRRAEERLRTQTFQQGAVAELNRLALSGAGVAELSNVAVSVVARRTGAESAALWEVLPGGCFMGVRASVGWTDEFLEGAAVDLGVESILSRALDSDEPVVFTRHTSDPRLAEPRHVRREAVSCVSVAVLGRSGPGGVLSVYTDGPGGFTEGDVHFIQAVAGVLSSAVGREQEGAERARLSPREQEARSEGGPWEMKAGPVTFDCAGQAG